LEAQLHQSIEYTYHDQKISNKYPEVL